MCSERCVQQPSNAAFALQTKAEEDAVEAGVPFRLLETGATEWSPNGVQPTLNARVDARLVPSLASPDGMRLDYAHVVVLDNFFGEPERRALLDHLTAPGWDHLQGPPLNKWERETADGAGAAKTWGLRDSVLEQLSAAPTVAMREIHSRLALLYPEADIAHMPAEHMQALAACKPDKPGTGAAQPQSAQAAGLSQAARPAQGHLRQESSSTAAGQPSGEGAVGLLQHDNAVVEGAPALEGAFNSRAPGHAEGSSPSAQDGQGTNGEERLAGTRGSIRSSSYTPSAGTSAEPGGEDSREPEQATFCAPFVGNAAVAGDQYTWHVDADPATLPDSRWTEAFGDYVNGEPGRPLLVSLLLYLDEAWPRDWAADTLFLDCETDVGLVVRPKRYRAVLMDQDVLHRVSAPSAAAGGRPRYSLVWKLAFLPKAAGHECCLARPEWGLPTSVGSAARVEAVRRSLARKRKAQEVQP